MVLAMHWNDYDYSQMAKQSQLGEYCIKTYHVHLLIGLQLYQLVSDLVHSVLACVCVQVFVFA